MVVYSFLSWIYLTQINENLECLWKLAERPGSQQKKAKIYEVSVTVYFDAIRPQRKNTTIFIPLKDSYPPFR